jgi:acyl-coenzyme A thioesterase PaaI-like protein
MITTVRTDALRKGDIIAEDRPRPRRLTVHDIIPTEITHAGRSVAVLELVCTDGGGRYVRRTATAQQTWAVHR